MEELKMRQFGFHHGFGPHGFHGFGHHGFHHGFGHHGFGRRFSPFFFLSPFGFGFRGEGEDRNRHYYAEYTVEHGDTMWKIAEKYNVPIQILITMNTHIADPNQLNIGDKVYIPRMHDMHCQRMYMEMADSSPMHMTPHYPTRENHIEG
jgi:hypothetical protein